MPNHKAPNSRNTRAAAERRRRLSRYLAVTLLALIPISACSESDDGTDTAGVSASWVRHWNSIAIDASGLDHTPVAPGENRTFGENLGPGRASRAMAIVHIAIFDAVNAIAGGYQSYSGLPPAPAGTSRARRGA